MRTTETAGGDREGCGRTGLPRHARVIICGGDAAGEPARRDAARARRPAHRRRRSPPRTRASRRRCSRRYGIATRLALAARAQRGARAADVIVASLAARTKRRAGQRRGHAGDQRPRRAARARGRARRAIRSCRSRGRRRSPRRSRPRGSTPSGSCSPGFCRRRPRRAASRSRRSPRCRWRSSCTRRRIACARPSPSWRWRCPVARTLVVARELTKTFETIARMPLARRRRRGSTPTPTAQRGEFVLIVDAPTAEVADAPEALSADVERWLARAARRAAAGARRARRRGGERGARATRLCARARAQAGGR